VGGIIQETRAALSRYTWAASSESADKWFFFANPKVETSASRQRN
jgi:hypothetical protein